MESTGFVSRTITTNKKETLQHVTCLTVSNYGDTELQLTVNGTTRLVPPLREDIGVPFGAFNLPCDGTACLEIRLEFAFTGGSGKAILDYRISDNPKNC